MKTARELIGNLLQAVETDNIDWDISINHNIVKAVYNTPLTKERTIYYKIIYNHQDPKETKLAVSIGEAKKERIKTTFVMSIDKNNFHESVINDINILLDKILIMHDYKKKHSKGDEIKVGDRVVVIKEQNFGGVEVGKKGTVIRKVEITSEGDSYWTICFDVKFNNRLTYSPPATKETCWIFGSDKLKKIKPNAI